MAGATLLINLTRFGDLLQTQPVISGLAQEGRRVELLCQENFAPTAQLLADLHAVHPMPGARFLSKLDKDWRLALAEVLRFKNHATAGGQDCILNLTATLPARLLARLAAKQTASNMGGEAELAGYALDEQGFSLTGNPWAALLIASTRHRGLSPFNLVDLFWKAASLPDVLPAAVEQPASAAPRPNRLRPPDEDLRRQARELLESRAAPGAGYVALQLGASENRRRYPVERFAAAAAELARTGLTPVLLGSKGEAPLAARFAEHYPSDLQLADLTGATSLPLLAAVLTHCRLLLTNDTGTMHLAAGLGLPIVSVFLATAQPWDTGPYLPGSLCLEPDMACHPCAFGRACPHDEACRRAIEPQTMTAAARALLSGGLLGGGLAAKEETLATLPADKLAGARVWLTGSDESGFLDLTSLSGHRNDDRTVWVRLQRRFYRQFLDDLPIEALACAEADGLSEKEKEAAKAVLQESVQLLTLLSSQAQVLAMAPRETVKKKFMAVWQRLQSLWDDSPRFSVLGYLFLVQTQEQQQDLESLGRLLGRYHELAAAWLAALDVA